MRTKDEAQAAHPAALPGPSRRRRWPFVAMVATAVAFLAWLLAFGLSRDPTVVSSPLIGKPAPAFSLPYLTGKGQLSLEQLRGRVVVINFWASWCAPCRKEHPHLMAAWERYRDRGVVLIGIDFNDTTSAARAYMRELGGDWPIVIDPGGRTALAYGVYGVPETFFIGRDGIIRHKHIGAVSYELLTTQVGRLLAEGESHDR